MGKRPNILFLVNDHQAYYRHGWDGGVRPMTPHFDRVAAGGVRFNRAYSAVPLCGPARRTLMTGLYPHNHRNYYNYTDSPYDHEIYLDRLAEAGYQNCYFGKWHVGPGTANDFSCQGFSDTDYGNPYINPVYKEYLQRKGLPQAEHYIERHFWNDVFRKQFPKLADNSYYRSEYAWCGEHAIGITTTPKETHEAFFLADLACDALTELAQQDSDQPFHLSVNFWGPHQPYFPTAEFAELYDPEEITEYGSFADQMANKPDLYFHDTNRPLSDDHDHFHTPSPLAWGDWQQILARAYAHITMVDAAGGLILAKLAELGLAEDTVVIWTSDHGDAVASHGGHFDKGSYLSEEVIRVPLAMRWPGQITPGQVNDQLICSTDIAPTILDLANTGFANPVDGESWLPLLRTDAAPWRETLMVETHGHGYMVHQVARALLTNRFKYICNHNQRDELYDLQIDPYELDNLIDHPAHQELLASLRAQLQAWQARTDDLGAADPQYQREVANDPDNLRAMAGRREAKVRRYGSLI